MEFDRLQQLRKLPQNSADWEVLVVPAPIEVENEELDGLVLVCESHSGLLLTAGPLLRGQDVWSILERAFAPDFDQLPSARPRRALVSDSALRDQLEPGLSALRIQVEVVEELRAAEEAARSLLAAVQPKPSIGLNVELSAWRAALRSLVEIAPWRMMSDAVLLQFEGSRDLRDTVAVVIGLAGEQVGVALYPNRETYLRFRAVSMSDSMDGLAGISALVLYLDPAKELDPDLVQQARDRGLLLSGDLVPYASKLSGAISRPAGETDQRALLAATQCLIALSSNSSVDLEMEAAAMEVDTVLGPVRVSSSPSFDLFYTRDPTVDLVPSEYAVGLLPSFGDGKCQLVIKLRKPDAIELADRLEEVDSVQFEFGPVGVCIYAYSGDTRLGLLVELDEVEPIARIGTGSEINLCVSAGGPKRPRVYPKDFVMTRIVTIRGAAGRSGQAPDPIFREPMQHWPKASATLLDFAAPLIEDSPPVEDVKATLDLAALVWSAIAKSDYEGDSSLLESLLEGFERVPAMAAMAIVFAMRKRNHFAGDPRIFVRPEVREGFPEATVRVGTSLPEGMTPQRRRSRTKTERRNKRKKRK